MGTLTFMNGVTIPVISEIETYTREQGEMVIAKYGKATGALPILINYGSHCAYFNLFRSNTPFEAAIEGHPGFAQRTDIPKVNAPQVVANLDTSRWVQVCFSSQPGDATGRSPHFKMPSKDRYVSLWDNEKLNDQIGRNGYVDVVKNFTTSGPFTLITGADVTRQLQCWGVTDVTTLEGIP